MKNVTPGGIGEAELSAEWIKGVERKQGPSRMIVLGDGNGRRIQLVSDMLQPTELRMAREQFRGLEDTVSGPL